MNRASQSPCSLCPSRRVGSSP